MHFPKEYQWFGHAGVVLGYHHYYRYHHHYHNDHYNYHNYYNSYYHPKDPINMMPTFANLPFS